MRSDRASRIDRCDFASLWLTVKNGGTRVRNTSAFLERYIGVFLFWIHVALVLERAQRGNDVLARLRWLNDAVEIPAFAGHKRIRKSAPELRDLLLPQFGALGLGRVAQFPFVHNINRAFRAHNRNFRRWPCKS